MKNLICSLAFLFIVSKSFSQYYESSYFLVVDGNYFCHSYVGLSNFNPDKNGNIYEVIIGHACLPCSFDYTLVKTGSPQSWLYSLAFNSFPDFKMFGDDSGNTYAFGSYYGNITINGTVIDLVTDAYHSALIKFDTIGQPLWAVLTNGTKISVNASGYSYVLNNDSVMRYSPDGLQTWTRQGGGSQIFANDNSTYYITDASGIKKYKSDGTVKWQINTGLSFQKTHNQRCFLHDQSLIQELDPLNGAVISTTPNLAGSSVLFDNNGNYFKTIGDSLIKFNSSGVEWLTQLTGTGFSNVGLDGDNNIHFAGNYVSQITNGYTLEPVKLFVPPDLYIDPAPVDNYSCGYSAVYVGKINQHGFTPKITTGNIAALCKESPVNIPFTVNKYLVTYTNGLRAELSDSTGNFASPLTIGGGIHSPIEARIPFFNTVGDHYKVRVSANSPEVIGKPSARILQAVYPPRAGIELSNSFDLGGNYSCAPVTLSVVPLGNNSYEWSKRVYGSNSFIPFYNPADNLVVAAAYGDDYMVKVTDTLTNCFTNANLNDLYASGSQSTLHVNFIIPDTVCINSAPVDLVSDYSNSEFSGAFIFNDKFYPDSAGIGLHAISLHLNNAPSCFASADTTKYIYVDDCIKRIQTTIILPAKNSYCSGDTIDVYFSYDAQQFDPGNIFKVQLGNMYGETFYVSNLLGTGTSSPVRCVIPGDIYGANNYRIRVVSTSPFVKGTPNYDGDLKMGPPETFQNFLIDETVSNCGNINSVLTLQPVISSNSVYIWHNGNFSFVDSVNWNSGTSFLATQPGDYFVEAINEFGCRSFTNTVHIDSLLKLPEVEITISNPYVCPDDSVLVTLSTSMNNVIEWSTYYGSFSPPDPTSFYVNNYNLYNVIVTSPAGCFIGNTVNIQEGYRTGINISAANNMNSFCLGDSLRLSASIYQASNQYEWFKDGSLISSGNNFYIYVHAIGTYELQLTNSYGCTSNSNSLTVTNFEAPTIAANEDTLGPCQGKTFRSLSLNLTGIAPWIVSVIKDGIQYYYNSNVTDASTLIYVDFTSEGWYSILATNPNCNLAGKDSVYVSYRGVPHATITPQGPLSFCSGGSVVLQANTGTGLTYKWKKGGNYIGGATSSSYTATLGGNYKVEVTRSNGCSNTSDGVTVTVPCRNEESLSKNDFNVTVYPNPSSGDFIFEMQNRNNEKTAIKISDISGRKILSTVNSSSRFIIVGQKLEAGVYPVLITNGKDQKLLKLVKTE